MNKPRPRVVKLDDFRKLLRPELSRWAPKPKVHSPEDRRQVLAALARTLLQKRDLDQAGLSQVLRMTLTRLQSSLEVGAAFVLMLDGTVGEASILGSSLPRTKKADSSQPALRVAQLGVLEGVQTVLDARVLREDEVPLALQDILGSPIQAAAAVPAAISPRLTCLLAVVNQGPGFRAGELALLEEVNWFCCRATQRALKLGAPLSEGEEARCIALLASCEYRDLRRPFQPDRRLLEAVGERVLKRYSVLPLRRLGRQSIEAAVPDPLDAQSLADFELVTGLAISNKVAAARSQIRHHLFKVYPGDEDEERDDVEVKGDVVAQLAHSLRDFEDDSYGLTTTAEVVTEDSSPIVRLANHLVEDAYLRGASDIHVETLEDRVVIRHRVDGTCGVRVTLPTATSRPLVARLKIMSELDLAEHRLPQDGRVDFSRYNPDIPIDLRVSVLPMLNGEWVCLRILEKKRSSLPLDELGFSVHNLVEYRQAVHTPYGLILHCGPTGAGKSMTLYAALNEINSPRLKILTAEDPVEYVLGGIGQLQIKPSIDLTFARALRSFLRHDPDIILVGEIRDEETARIAVDASLTGHLLLSTLHTNDAASSVARLTKLGIEPFLIANTVVSVCAQRLIRKLCVCKQRVEPTVRERSFLKRGKDGGSVGAVHRAMGCAHCNRLGYRGRTGVHELMVFSNRLRQQIVEGASAEVLKETARGNGMRTLFEDCIAKVKAGVTSLEEVFRVSKPDEVV